MAAGLAMLAFFLVNAASTEARAIGAELGARTFGTTDDADFRLEVVSAGPERARVRTQASPRLPLRPRPAFHRIAHEREDP